jgi:flagellar protein FlaJ
VVLEQDGMPLNKYQKLCYRWFGRRAEQHVPERLKTGLESAHINMRASAYLSCTWLNTILAVVISTAVIVNLVFFILPALNVEVQLFIQIILLILPVVIGSLAYLVYLNLPSSRAKARAKKIDVHLPYALNFISAMCSAGLTPTEIFKSLAKQDIYGEIKEEASWIYRDVTLLGKDILTAIRSNIARTPSQKFKEFLQGTVVTVTSGGSLKSYFMAKAEQYMEENRQVQKQFIESLGIMAEAYVVAAVAGVLLIILVIPLMMLASAVSSTGLSPEDFKNQMQFLLIFIFLVVPMIHAGFAVGIKSMSQGV